MVQKYTRKMIREVFVERLNKVPLHKITVKELVAACEINRNTFYYYYADLYEVLNEVFEMEFQKVIDEYNETLSWEESFLLATRFALENQKAIEHIYTSVRREALEDYIYKVAGNVMTRYVVDQSKNIKASSEDQKLIACFYQSALTQMILQWISAGMKQDAKAMILRVGKLFDGNIKASLERSEQLRDRW